MRAVEKGAGLMTPDIGGSTSLQRVTAVAVVSSQSSHLFRMAP